ncbi:MAG TPA: hypothetical protein PLL69_09120, partial [Gemmatimonadales bacterium]|nr:hypothetical protein [Gemmatimonadales bacterium]
QIAGNHDTPRSADSVPILGLFHELGIEVVVNQARRIVHGDLSVLAVPHQALFGEQRPAMERAGAEPYQVLVLHGETPGLFGKHRSIEEPGGANLSEQDLGGAFDYVALGHYHVQHQVRERVWYAGSLDYVSSDPWGELRAERDEGIRGKGWLLVNLDSGVVERKPIEAPRRVIDIPWLDAGNLAANELNRLLAEAVDGVKGGIEDAVVRLVVRNVPRPVARELDHAMIREWKSRALHFHLDLRQPDKPSRSVGTGAPGVRRTLDDELREFLQSRKLPPGVDREALVGDGLALLAELAAAGEGD